MVNYVTEFYNVALFIFLPFKGDKTSSPYKKKKKTKTKKELTKENKSYLWESKNNNFSNI